MTEHKKAVEKTDRHFWLLWCIPLTVGIFLRLYMIADQIPLDDEWHGIDFAADHSLWYILTHYIRAGATCIPLNVYGKLLLDAYGFSEIPLILPSLGAGILSLIIFPCLLRNMFSTRILFIFAMLVAISPFLIFYSRFGRPYSIYCFLSFVSIISLYRWSCSGEKFYAILYLFAGAITIWFHFFAVVSVLAPLFCLSAVRMLNLYGGKAGDHIRTAPDFSDLLKISGGIVFITALLMFYPIWNKIGPAEAGHTEYSLYTVIGLTGILAGTANPFLIIVFFILFFTGLICLCRIHPVLGAMIFFVVSGYFLIFAILRPYMTSVPVIMARYLIPVFPITFLSVALGADCLAEKMRILSVSSFSKGKQMGYGVMTGFFLAAVFWTGPIKNICQTPNNFTNHSAFQENYTRIDWNHARPSDTYWPIKLRSSNISDFYTQLSQMPDVKKIIEYPMPLGNHFNPFYYYQHFHKKEVAAGYVRFNYKDVLPASVKKEKGKISGNYYIDFVLSKVRDPRKLKFRNIVDISDIRNAAAIGADFLVLHKHIIRELKMDLPENLLDDIEPWTIYPLVRKLEASYRKACGNPVFEDSNILVFKIR